MIDPTTLATVTAAVSVLGTEFTKGLAGEAGKNTWGQIKRLFGWNSEPQPSDLAGEVAKKLQESPDLASKVVKLLQENQGVGSASQLVGKIDAEKVVVAQVINASEFNM